MKKRTLSLLQIIIIMLLLLTACKGKKDPGKQEDPSSDSCIHTPQAVIGSSATCTLDGLTDGEICSTCHAVLTPQEIIPALGHTYESNTTAPTCTEQGYTVYTCHCGDTYADSYTDALGHTPATISGKAATCTEAGLTDGSECSVCGEILTAQQTIGALGHTYEANTTAPTCTEQGYTVYTCRCGDTYTDSYTAALGHTYEAKTTAPTCTEQGYTVHTCHCGDTYTGSYIPALGHTVANDEYVAPTCILSGLTAGTHCSACKTTLTKQEVIPATGHTNETIEGVAATCTDVGLTEGIRCSECKTVIKLQEMIPAAGHKETIVPKVEATCTKSGLTEGLICNVCQTVFKEQNEIPALGHSTVADAPKDATCTEDGLTEGSHCSYCLEIFTPQETIPATGHSWDTELNCSVCGTPKPSEGLEFVLRSDGVSYSVDDIGVCTDERLVIPCEYNGFPVVEVAKNAFKGCSVFKTVIIPSSVTTIGSYAFSGSSLETLDIPDTVTSIGTYAFSSCSALKSVTVGAGIDTIPSHAFYKNKLLTDIYIPGNVTTIDSNAFYGCTSLLTLELSEGLITIGTSAFENCSAIEALTIPTTVTTINSSAFSSCKGLNSVTIKELAAWFNISFGGEWSNPLRYAQAFYVNGKQLTELIVPDGVTEIKSYAFYSFTGITSLAMADSVTYIGDYSFYNCDGLLEETIGDGVIETGSHTFASCDNLYTVDFGESLKTLGNNAFYECKILHTVGMCNALEIIEKYAFSGCKALTQIHIPESLKKIETEAFAFCTSLEGVYITDFTAWCSIEFANTFSANPLYYAKHLYIMNATVHAVTFPMGMTEIHQELRGCIDLIEVNIHKGVTSIDSYAFKGCESLTTINYEGTIEEWKTITKDAMSWSTESGTCTVICSNGTYIDGAD